MVKGYFNMGLARWGTATLLTISAAIGIILAMSVTGIWGGRYEGLHQAPNITLATSVGRIQEEGMMDLLWLLAKGCLLVGDFRRWALPCCSTCRHGC